MEISEIKKELKSTDLQRVQGALYYLFDNKTFDEEIVSLIAKLVTSKDKGIQSLAIDCLKNIPDEFKPVASQNIAPLVASDNIEHRNIASDILVNYNDLCYDALKQYLKHPIADVRQFALDIWGNIGSKKDWDIVHSMLEDENKNVVVSAIMALGNIKVAEAIDDLIKKYDEDDEYKPFVLNSLGKIGGEKARDFILRIINTETDQLLQLAAIDALAYFEVDADFVSYLLKKLLQSPPRVQPYFLKTVCNIGKKYANFVERPKELKEIARNALKDEDIEIRKAALNALGNSYDVLDVDSLIIELLRLEPENMEYIFQNIVKNSDVEVFSDFVEKLAYQKDNGELFSSLQEFIFREWDAMTVEKKIALINSVLQLADELPIMVVNDFCDWFSYREPETFRTVLQKVLQNSTSSVRHILEELASKYF